MQRSLVIIAVVLLLAAVAYSQVTFTVKPGALINTAEMGMRVGKINPFAGVDIVWITVSGSERDEYEYVDNYGSWYYHHRSLDEYEFSGSAFLLVPNIGAKYYFNTDFSEGSMVPYLKGSLFFSIPSVKGESESKSSDWYYDEYGQIEDFYYDIDKWELEGKDKEMVEDILSFWGLNLFGGCEYYLSDNFSIGGEFGIRLLFNSFEVSNESSSGSPSGSYYDSDSWETEVSATFKITQALVNLNYSF